MNIDLEAIRLTPGQSLDDALFLNQVARLTAYLDHPEGFEPGSVVLAPTYRLEEVEEIIEPEKPGAPVEPYVGLMWKNSSGERRVVISVNSTHYEVLQEQLIDSDNRWVRGLLKITDLCWDNYPDTPSTPAVTRKVKKWVKIDHPEAPE